MGRCPNSVILRLTSASESAQGSGRRLNLKRVTRRGQRRTTRRRSENAPPSHPVAPASADCRGGVADTAIVE